MNNKLLYLNERIRQRDKFKIQNPQRINSKIEIYNDANGELIWEPLHNKTVIAGAALTMMKLFNFDRSVLENTPTYDETLGLISGANGTTYPTVVIKDTDGNTIGSMQDETQRIILGWCVGNQGSGLDASDVFDVPYASWITPDALVPFRYPLVSADDVDEDIYKGKKEIALANGETVNAYYFKEFSNTPQMVQNYVSTIGTFTDRVSAENVYNSSTSADKAQTYVELHLKLTNQDCREFYIKHSGLESSKVNQISLVYGWKKTVEVSKMNVSGNTVTKNVEYYQDVRPFSLIHIPSEILSDRSKSLSIIYTLYA